MTIIYQKSSLAQQKPLCYFVPEKYFLPHFSLICFLSIYIHMLSYGPIFIHIMGYYRLVGNTFSFIGYISICLIKID